MSQTLIIRGAKSLSDALSKLAGLPLDKPWSITVEHLDRKRSLQQNALYWATLSHIAQQIKDEEGKRYSPEVWHCYFKSEFLGKHTMIVDGQPVLVEKSTTSLKVLEFGEYIFIFF